MDGKTVKETSIITTYVIMPADANPAGNVHGGVIMKNIDNTAAMVGMRHARSNVVTASIDRMDFHNPAFIGELLILKASMNFVGKSSMEIGVRVEAENMLYGEKRHIASAYLTFVSLDRNHKPKELLQLILETDEDKRRNAQAVERRKIRIAEKKREEKD